MAYLETFDPYTFSREPSWPLQQLSAVAQEALRFPRAVDLQDLRSYAKQLAIALEQRKSDLIVLATNAAVERLLRDGGPELQFYPKGPLTETGVRALLANWPDDAEVDSPVPSMWDFSDLDVLSGLLESATFENPRYPSEGSYDEVRNADELWGLLALLKVEEAVLCLSTAGTEPTKYDIARAGDLAIEAALAVSEAIRRREWIYAELRASPENELPSKPPAGVEQARKAPRKSPPGARGNSGRRRQYEEIEAFVRGMALGARQRGAGRYDKDRLIEQFLQEIPRRFVRRSDAKGGKRGEPMTVKRSTLEGWLRKV